MTARRLSALRALVRAATVCMTAFVAGMSAEQVAAIQLVAEAALQVASSFWQAAEE